MKELRLILNCIMAIVEDGGYGNLVLKNATLGLPAVELRRVYATVYTVIEHLLYLDWVLSHYCKRQKRVVRNILRLALARGLYMGVPAYAATDSAVELCKSCGKGASAAVVNAVLKKALSSPLPPLPMDELESLSLQYSFPKWLVELLQRDYGTAQTRALLAASPAKMELRAQWPYTTDQLMSLLQEGYTVGKLDNNCIRLDEGIDIGSMTEFKEGKLTVQSEGSMLICRALGDVSGKRVLDACSAPGGKSAYIYSLCKGNVGLTCWELHEHRTELLNKTLDRLRVNATVEQRDASVFDAAYENAFDAVLLDAPCSGLGLLHSKLDIRYSKTSEDIIGLCRVQKQLLDCCCKYVKSGGRLVYSTCTICKDENDRQVDAFLTAHREFALIDMRQLLPHRDGVDGFFFAVMEKCI